MTRTRQNNKRGFTLIELLVVCGMMAVISLVIHSTLFSGIRLWQRMDTLKVNEDLNIFLERFAADIANSFEFTGIGFTGQQDSLTIPALVKSPIARINIPGKVVYAYDRQNKVLTRSQMDYSQSYLDVRVTPDHALTGINSCKFSYRVFDKQKKEYSWSEENTADRLPDAVRMELGLGSGSGGYAFNKTVSIPVSGELKE
ncbi:MAG: type II secretion system protein [Candidatus Omnitrophica bacterium]|jgi:prepilin-type N-terminal cleavage/methylation domain-containing protein|nr:type II secretion system GspH family protein [Candidatus Omnitrophota bacterium]MDD5078753.1 type II secretion system protein [Candidatus Omnitrophota bacterium]